MKNIIFFILLFSTQTYFACTEVKDVGCFIKVLESAPLIIYFRGHNKGRPELPKNELFESASKMAIKADLAKLALELKVNILVTGSSRVIITSKLLDTYHFEKLFLAAHSGGYYGLWKTIEDKNIYPKLKKLIFLDSYYSAQLEFHQLLKNLIHNGVPCVGYLTEHNLERFDLYYKNLQCTKNGPNNFSHSKHIYTCLKQLILGNQCSI